MKNELERHKRDTDRFFGNKVEEILDSIAKKIDHSRQEAKKQYDNFVSKDEGVIDELRSQDVRIRDLRHLLHDVVDRISRIEANKLE